MLADERLDAGGIEISDRHDRHSVGPIELSIEVAETLGRKRLQHFRQPYRQAVRVFRGSVESAHLHSFHACRRSLPASPLFDDHAAFAIDLARLERDAGGKVAQRIESPDEDLFAVGRELEHVHRLVKAGVRVDVWTEPRTDRFEVVDELSRLEMCRAVECHVLEQMCEAALIVCLVYRARLDDETHRRSFFGLSVLSNEKPQAVRQAASANRGVERQRRRQILRGGANGGAQDEQQQVCCVDAAQNTASESHDSSSFICHP